MTRVSRWCTLAGITAGLLGLTAQAFGATGWPVITPTATGTFTGSFALSDTDAWVLFPPSR
jgi:hypothetical protein